MNFTEPSHIAKLAPPGWSLRKLYHHCQAPLPGSGILLKFSGMAVEPTDWLAWTQAFQLVTLPVVSPTRKVLEVPSMTCFSATEAPWRQKIPEPVPGDDDRLVVVEGSPSWAPRQG